MSIMENGKETFVLFKQLSMDFIPNDTKTKRRNKHEADHNHELHLQFAIYHTLTTLLQEFKYQLKYKGYKCMDISDKQILIIRLGLRDRFKKLFLCRQPPKFILTITTHQFLSVRTVSIKPLKSKSIFSSNNIPGADLSNEVNRIGQLLLGLRNLSQANPGEINQLENQYKQDFYSLGATSYFMFTRMLVDSNYTIGQKISEVFRKFKDASNMENCSKVDIRWLHQALNEINQDLLQGFNCSRSQLLQILTYCRKSVQQYYHNVHLQQQVNQGKFSRYDSMNYLKEIDELTRLAPQTLKQFNNLERAKTSMDIFKMLFLINLIFKAECTIKNFNQKEISEVNYLLKVSFSSVINQKIYFLKSFGYDETTFEPFIHLFYFDHEITL